MSLWGKFVKAKRRLFARIEHVFGNGPAVSPLAVKKDVLDIVTSRGISDPNGKSLPFGRIVVRLQPQTEAERVIFEESLVRADALKVHLLQALREADVQCNADLQIRIEMQEIPGSGGKKKQHPFEIDFVRPYVIRQAEVPEIKLVVIRGKAQQPEYTIKKDRILIGRPAEVLDREGRIVRKNDIVFLENEDETAASVGSAHARIWFDYDKCGYWIMDEGSRYGTRVLRDRNVIEVPGQDPAGVQLQTGDDLYFGQAAMRFESTGI
jgi:hypothetical protein